MTNRHVLTPKRAAALKKAQAASARKRRGTGKARVSSTRRRVAARSTIKRRNTTAVAAKKRGWSRKRKVAVAAGGIAVVAGAGAVGYAAYKSKAQKKHPTGVSKNAVKKPQGKMIRAYHITQREFAPSIIATGIRPQRQRIDIGGGNGYAHVTTDVRAARAMGERFRGPNTVVLETRVNRHHLKPDTFEGGAPHYRIKPEHVGPITVRARKRARVSSNPFARQAAKFEQERKAAAAKARVKSARRSAARKKKKRKAKRR